VLSDSVGTARFAPQFFCYGWTGEVRDPQNVPLFTARSWTIAACSMPIVVGCAWHPARRFGTAVRAS